MSFDKPKVTIDLEEYNYLKNNLEKWKKFKTDDIETQKRIMAILLKYCQDGKQLIAANNILKQEGLYCYDKQATSQLGRIYPYHGDIEFGKLENLKIK